MTQATTDRAILIIDDGAPASLAACLLCEDTASSLLWIPQDLPAPRSPRIEAVRRHADLLGFPAPLEAAEHPQPPLAIPRMLLAAASEAGRRGCPRVIWPIHHGDDLDDMARAADQAALLTHLARLEGDSPAHTPVSIHTPFLDLTDDQLIDLARDLDLPAEACWWCERESPEPCARCDSCRRWSPLLSIGRHSPAPARGATV
ncbi:MAG: hypothetical protein EA376_14075 [Phycisphaeraceae bacterium]|nr:MAG: hypothetical protein EA376_14075 [Phycisphaeraceae bacterium]